MRYIALLGILCFPQDKPVPPPPKPADPKPQAQDPAPIDSRLQGRIDVAVEKGIAWLLEQAKGDRINMTPGLPGGMDHSELVLYALIYGGADYDHAGFQKVLAVATTAKLGRTYRVALTAMCLEAFDRSKYQARIAECAQFLADTQCKNGQWSYGEATKKPDDTPTGGDGKPVKGDKNSTVGTTTEVKARAAGPPTGDNSNTQYAALGIRSCAKAGVTVEKKVVEAALKWWESSMHADGGWGYASNGQVDGDPVYGSMTAGAVASMVIYNTLLKDAKKDPKKHDKTLKGVEWMGKNLVYDKNPGLAESYRWVYYWLYGIERAGDLFGTDTFGPNEWYTEGSSWLLDRQEKNGRWEGREHLVITDTCFAILFLRRATKLAPKVATGGTKDK